MSLRDWSPWRIALIWLAWPASVAFALFVVATVIVWRSESRAMHARAALPAQYSDFRIDTSRPAALAFWLGPPLLLTAIWLWRRTRGRAT